MLSPLLISLAILLFIGAPVFVALCLSSCIALIFFSDAQFMIIAQRLVGGVDKFSLMAIPFFIFAANIMKTGGIARRILDWCETFVGGVRGGLGMTTEVTCMFFGAVSGSSPATVIAVGGLTYPKMVEKHYPKGFATGLVTSSGSVALLIPPSITAIVYCSATGCSVGALFMAGLTAGVLYGLCFLAYIWWYCRKHKIPAEMKSTAKEKWQATKKAAWALGIPIIILGGIYTGIFTPTEAAGVSAIYAIIISLLVYREMTLKQLWKCCVLSAGSTAQVMILLAVASLFGYVLTVDGVPQAMSSWIIARDFGPTMFCAAVCVILLIEGMFIDGSSAVIITAPLLFNAAVTVGVHEIHLGVLMVACASIGMFTPPFGLNLFVAQSVTGNKIGEIFKGVLPFIAVSLVALAVMVVWPNLSLWLPRALYGMI